MRKYKEVAMKNKLRRKLTALALCGVMIFSGSSSALADSPVGEGDEATVIEEVIEAIEEQVEEQAEEPQAEIQEDVTEETPVVEEIP